MTLQTTNQPRIFVDGGTLVAWLHQLSGTVVMEGEEIPFYARVIVTTDYEIILDDFDCEHPKAAQVRKVLEKRMENGLNRWYDEYPTPLDFSFDEPDSMGEAASPTDAPQ